MGDSSLRIAAWIAALSLASVASAQDTLPVVVVFGEAGAASRLEALGVELAPRRLTVVPASALPGPSVLARAAAAQGSVSATGAAAGLWIEETAEGGASVRVVGPRDEHVRYAPLPSTVALVDPRTFALVAASLLDELVGAPEREIPVRVHVDLFVDGHGRPVEVETALGDAAAQPAVVARADAPPPALPEPSPTSQPTAPLRDEGEEPKGLDLPIFPREGLVLEVGVSSALIWNGGMAGLSYYVSDDIRMGVLLRFGTILDDGAGFGTASFTTLFVEPEASARFDHGPELGVVVGNLIGVLAAYQVGYTWETSLGASIGVRATAGGMVAEEIYPFAMLSVLSELPI